MRDFREALIGRQCRIRSVNRSVPLGCTTGHIIGAFGSDSASVVVLMDNGDIEVDVVYCIQITDDVADVVAAVLGRE